MNPLIAVTLVLALYSVEAQLGGFEGGGINQQSQIVGEEVFDKGLAASGQGAFQGASKLAAGDQKQEQLQAFDRVKGSGNAGVRAGQKGRLGAFSNGKGQVLGNTAKFHNANIALSDKGGKSTALSFKDEAHSDQAFRINANEGFKDNGAFQIIENNGIDAANAEHFGAFDSTNLFADSGLGVNFGAESFLSGQEKAQKFGQEELHAKSAGKGQLSLADKIFGDSQSGFGFKRK